MKKTVAALLCVIVAALLLCSCSQAIDLPDEKTLDKVLTEEGYQIVFEDDFDGDSIDYTKWKTGYESPSRRAAYYEDSEDTLFVSDGCLTIRTLYKDGQFGEGWYTSWVETATKEDSEAVVRSEDYSGFSSKYGYFEVRCIAPPCTGIWSAFWLMPDEGTGMSADDVAGTGADGVEIDVMESPGMYSSDKETNVHVVHGDG